jgi:long-chain acyl-CoA synthetase
LQSEIRLHVEAVNRKLSHVEQVKKWVVIAHDFQVGEELTPTLKVKRKIVNEKYADAIDGLYNRQAV